MKAQSRPNGAWETSRNARWWRRLTLRRADGRLYLERWALAIPRRRDTRQDGRVPAAVRLMVHRMDAPDPGIDLHDHPFWFASLVLWGGYTELRADTRDAPLYARLAEKFRYCERGVRVERRWLSVRTMRLDECHTIIDLHRRRCWTLVLAGPDRRRWGFYLPDGYMPEEQYDRTVRADRRDVWSDENTDGRPW